jgi:hypothetical protein
MGLLGGVSSNVAFAFRFLGENLVAEAGGHLYASGALMIGNWNRTGDIRPLDDYQKRHLRPMFGGLVDRVQVTYRARLWEEVKLMGIKIGTASSAQTFGHRIYMKEEYRPNNRHQVFLLAHELVHSRQFEDAGRSLIRFGNRYFRGYYRAGFDYRTNLMEHEAYDLQRDFAASFVEIPGDIT